MTSWDDRILSVLKEGGTMSTTEIVNKMGIIDIDEVKLRRGYIAQKLRVLTKFGLVECVSRGRPMTWRLKE